MTRFSLALLASLCLHGLVISTCFVLMAYEPAVKLSTPSIQVSLTKLGAPRDHTLLPRIDAGPLKKPDIKSKDPLNLLRKRFGKPSFEGQKQGSILGSSLNQELANSYESQVLELLRAHYEIPRVISEREAKHLKLWIKLWIAPNGDLLKMKIQKTSQNTRFDQAVLDSAQKIPSFGAPPLQLTRKYKAEGLLIQFCPLECS